MEAWKDLDPLALSLTAVSGIAMMGGTLLALVVALRRWDQTRAALPRALRLAGGVALLQLPALAFQLAQLDPTQVQVENPEVTPALATVALGLGVVFALLFFLTGAFLQALQVPATRLAGGPGPAFPLLFGEGAAPRAGWGVAALLGGVGAAATWWLFGAMGVDGSEAIEALLRESAGLPESGPGLWLWLAGSLSAAALAEELLFRGVLLRWLARWLGGGRSAVVNAVLFTAVVWAFGHALNAEPMAPKLVQITLLGVGFGWLSLRYSVEAAMVAHLVLNLTVLGLSAWAG